MKREEIKDMKKVILLTGASSGIGYQTAESLAKEGHVVYGAARRTEKMETLKQFVVKPIYLDVTDEEGDDVTNDIFVGAKAELEKTVWMVAAELGQAPGL